MLLALGGCAGKSKNHDDSDGGRGGTPNGRGGSTANVVVKTVTQRGVDKIDLLFVIDNSPSMADKQALLAESVPALLGRLTSPRCLDETGSETGDVFPCPSGTPEFPPIENIHFGIITSSLGGHGGDVCVPDPQDPVIRSFNDRAQLLASVRTGLYSYQNLGFLVWDPRTGSERPAPDPHPGVTNREQALDDFAADLSAHIEATGDGGCAYEASLEAWYRFLVDPEPIGDVINDGTFSVRGPVNSVVLAQRAAFMRPDSLLAIVMFTDENDCSILDENGEQGWLVGRRAAMPRGSDACSRPDDPNIYRCCIPCVVLSTGGFIPEPGCNYGNDVACSMGNDLTQLEDSQNLRCYDQMRRFGVDLLYPWQRYVEGLTRPRIVARDSDVSGGVEVPNPIYSPGLDGTPARELGLVFLAGIVGVPWQDIATPETLTGRALKYIPVPQLPSPIDANGIPTGPNRWDVVLGDPDTGRPPLDPFMIESIDERAAGTANPVVPSIQIISSSSVGTNAINGHEQNVVNRDELQYACTYPLPTPIPCDTTNGDGCDCNASEREYNRPVCQYSSDGQDGTQTHGKAFPSVRQLQVLKGFGDNAAVASICPKNVVAQGDAATDPDYGYNPAIHALVDRFREPLAKTCLPRPLVPDAAGQVGCSVVEARPTGRSNCSCNTPGRSSVTDDALVGPIHDELMALSLCGSASGVSCFDYCLCEVEELEGAELEACQNSLEAPSDLYGFCYVDPDNGFGNPGLVATCPETQRQIIRFVGVDLPAPGAIGFIACRGAN
jgi:hypothetical protein